MVNDADFIAASVSNPQQFAEIFERHFVPIHRYVSRRLGTDMADDVAAQVFTIAFERRTSFKPSSLDARPWLYGIASNLIRNNRRSERRLLVALTRLVGQAEPGYCDEVTLGFDPRQNVILARALNRLDHHQRDVLLLHCWAGLSHAEIAAALGIPAGTVASRLSRARCHVRDALDAGIDDTKPSTAVPTSKEKR